MLARLTLALALILAALPAQAGSTGSAYDFSFDSIDGGPLPLSQYRGKVVLVVNTASFCGYTYQYGGLEKLWNTYRARGFVLLGVPSNDFGQQEPGTSGEIKKFCKVNYSIDFPLTTKVHVTGADAHPFYKWAAKVLGKPALPRWNFHKYLVSADGHLVAWFPSRTEPSSPQITRAIERELGKAGS